MGCGSSSHGEYVDHPMPLMDQVRMIEATYQANSDAYFDQERQKLKAKKKMSRRSFHSFSSSINGGRYGRDGPDLEFQANYANHYGVNILYLQVVRYEELQHQSGWAKQMKELRKDKKLKDLTGKWECTRCHFEGNKSMAKRCCVCKTRRKHQGTSKKPKKPPSVNLELQVLLQQVSQATSLTKTGYGLFKLTQYDAAFNNYSEAMTFFEAVSIVGATSENNDILEAISDVPSLLAKCAFNRANCLLAMQKYKEAYKDALTCVKVLPDWYMGHFMKAQIYYKLGYVKRAKLIFQECMNRVNADHSLEKQRPALMKKMQKCDEVLQRLKAMEKNTTNTIVNDDERKFGGNDIHDYQPSGEVALDPAVAQIKSMLSKQDMENLLEMREKIEMLCNMLDEDLEPCRYPANCPLSEVEYTAKHLIRLTDVMEKREVQIDEAKSKLYDMWRKMGHDFEVVVDACYEQLLELMGTTKNDSKSSEDSGLEVFSQEDLDMEDLSENASKVLKELSYILITLGFHFIDEVGADKPYEDVTTYDIFDLFALNANVLPRVQAAYKSSKKIRRESERQVKMLLAKTRRLAKKLNGDDELTGKTAFKVPYSDITCQWSDITISIPSGESLLTASVEPENNNDDDEFLFDAPDAAQPANPAPRPKESIALMCKANQNSKPIALEEFKWLSPLFITALEDHLRWLVEKLHTYRESVDKLYSDITPVWLSRGKDPNILTSLRNEQQARPLPDVLSEMKDMAASLKSIDNDLPAKELQQHMTLLMRKQQRLDMNNGDEPWKMVVASIIESMMQDTIAEEDFDDEEDAPFSSSEPVAIHVLSHLKEVAALAIGIDDAALAASLPVEELQARCGAKGVYVDLRALMAAVSQEEAATLLAGQLASNAAENRMREKMKQRQLDNNEVDFDTKSASSRDIEQVNEVMLKSMLASLSTQTKTLYTNMSDAEKSAQEDMLAKLQRKQELKETRDANAFMSSTLTQKMRAIELATSNATKLEQARSAQIHSMVSHVLEVNKEIHRLKEEYDVDTKDVELALGRDGRCKVDRHGKVHEYGAVTEEDGKLIELGLPELEAALDSYLIVVDDRIEMTGRKESSGEILRKQTARANNTRVDLLNEDDTSMVPSDLAFTKRVSFIGKKNKLNERKVAAVHDATALPLSMSVIYALEVMKGKFNAALSEVRRRHIAQIRRNIIKLWDMTGETYHHTNPDDAWIREDIAPGVDVPVSLVDKFEAEYEKQRTAKRGELDGMVDQLLTKIQELHVVMQLHETWRVFIRDHPRNDLLTWEGFDFLQSCHVRLKAKKNVVKLIANREAFIEEIKNFEVKATDKNRLYGSSLRLVEEQKFRKTCYPRLRKKDVRVLGAVRDYVKMYNEPFIYPDATDALQMIVLQLQRRPQNLEIHGILGLKNKLM